MCSNQEEEEEEEEEKEEAIFQILQVHTDQLH